jgi:hypothetical protein
MRQQLCNLTRALRREERQLMLEIGVRVDPV